MSTGPDETDWSDDWEPIEVWRDDWRAGRISTAELAVRIVDQLLDLVNRDPDEWFDDHPVEPRDLFNGEWYRWSKRLTFVGFTAEDYSALLDSITPRLPESVLKMAPAPSDRSSERTPRARIYLDIDGAFSPYCLQECDGQHLASMPATAIDQAPDTGWTWKMTALGLGPTPIPLELSQHLVELNDSDEEIVWNSTWQKNARFLRPRSASRTPSAPILGMRTTATIRSGGSSLPTSTTTPSRSCGSTIKSSTRAPGRGRAACRFRICLSVPTATTASPRRPGPASPAGLTTSPPDDANPTSQRSLPGGAHRRQGTLHGRRPWLSPLRSWSTTAPLCALDPEPPSAKHAHRDDGRVRRPRRQPRIVKTAIRVARVAGTPRDSNRCIAQPATPSPPYSRPLTPTAREARPGRVDASVVVGGDAALVTPAEMLARIG